MRITAATATVVASLIAALGGLAQVWMQQRAQERQFEIQKQVIDLQAKQIKRLEAESVGPLKAGQKICRVWAPEIWTDSLIVPKSWQPGSCASLGTTYRKIVYTLGCVYEDGTVSWGTDNGGIPERDCGWAQKS